MVSFFVFLLFHWAVSAQVNEITVQGTVLEVGTGIPFPAANVVEKGTQNVVMTDFDGNFTINVPSCKVSPMHF